VTVTRIASLATDFSALRPSGIANQNVIGELALGNLRQRKTVLTALSDLPHATVATDREVLQFIDRYALFGKGIGYIDTHLLAAARLTNGVQLWAADNKLHDVADELGVAFK